MVTQLCVGSLPPFGFIPIGCLAHKKQLFLYACGASLEVVFGLERRATYFGLLKAKAF
jgi:hypothetical protein